jgi:prepilin-type N-terminal cleavage/methylation domain-containing protein/prepilin-type processing-associated H-X9-DG protein
MVPDGVMSSLRPGIVKCGVVRVMIDGKRMFSAAEAVIITVRRTKMRTKGLKNAHGFTLVELLVVIAIIAVLIAIMMPALGRVKWQSKVFNCKSNYRAWGIATNLFAGDNNGDYPSYPLETTSGENPWDVNIKFNLSMHDQYGISWKMFFCPAQSEQVYPGTDVLAFRFLNNNALTVSAQNDPTQSSMELMPIGPGTGRANLVFTRHSWWVPRVTANGRWFPVEFSADPTIKPKKCAPYRDIDPTRSIYPIMTDFCYGDMGSTNIADIRVGGHKRQDVIESINVLYADGRVETTKTGELRPKFTSRQATHWW